LAGKPTRLVGSGSCLTLDFGKEVGGIGTLHFAAASDPNLSDVVKGTIAQDANASAVFEGVAPANKVSSILANLKSTLWTQYGPLSFSANTGFHAYISPYASKVELQARLSTDDTG
jgi:hypothetical protein